MKKIYHIIAAVLLAGVIIVHAEPVVLTETWQHRGKTFRVEKSDRNTSWCYVHNGTRLLAGPFYSNGQTTTRNKLVATKTWEKCKKKLKLDDPKFTITPEQMEQIYRIDDEQKAGNEKDNE